MRLRLSLKVPGQGQQLPYGRVLLIADVVGKAAALLGFGQQANGGFHAALLSGTAVHLVGQKRSGFSKGRTYRTAQGKAI